MPTGPSSNQYIIPDILLSDTFNEWLTVTNTDIIEKLNFLKVYTATGTGGITVDTLTNGDAQMPKSMLRVAVVSSSRVLPQTKNSSGKQDQKHGIQAKAFV